MSPRIYEYNNKEQLSYCGTPVHFKKEVGQWMPTNGKWVKLRASKTNATEFNVLVADKDPKPKGYYEDLLLLTISSIPQRPKYAYYDGNGNYSRYNP
jgi:hypothetical protein